MGKVHHLRPRGIELPPVQIIDIAEFPPDPQLLARSSRRIIEKFAWLQEIRDFSGTTQNFTVVSGRKAVGVLAMNQGEGSRDLHRSPWIMVADLEISPDKTDQRFGMSALVAAYVHAICNVDRRYTPSVYEDESGIAMLRALESAGLAKSVRELEEVKAALLGDGLDRAGVALEPIARIQDIGMRLDPMERYASQRGMFMHME